jgi:methyltransferase (TIGR00027 family)
MKTSGKKKSKILMISRVNMNMSYRGFCGLGIERIQNGKKQGVGSTALGAAVCRLIEQYQSKGTRLFDDPVVKDMVGVPFKVMMHFASIRNFTIKQTDAFGEGIYGAQICRTRFIDDAVKIALSEGVGQLVILGAGFDTRPHRLSGMERVKVFEVDLPGVQNNKKKKLQKNLGHLPENVTFIPFDFDTQILEAIFAGTAFDPSEIAVFIWEGVTQYLSEEAVRRTLSFVGKSAAGSIIVFTYILKSIIERRSDIPDANKMMDAVAKYAPWIFGLDPSSIPSFIEPYHLTVTADVGNADYQETYLKPLKRNLTVSEGERIVQAVVTSP